MTDHLKFPSGKMYQVVSETVPLAKGGLFRDLSDEEEIASRRFAQDMQDEPGGIVVNPVWHPSVQDELLTSGRGVEKGEPEP